MQKYKNIFLLILFIAAAIYGCAQVVEQSPPLPPPQSYGILMGTITDPAGAALTGVSVTAGGLSASTNDQGWFSLANIAASSREVVNLSLAGQITTQKIVAVQAGQSTFLNAVMNPLPAAQTFSAEAGGTVNMSTSTGLTASVTFPAGAFVDSAGSVYTGPVSLYFSPFDPASTESFPGEFSGVQSGGTTVPIKSFGYLNIIPRDGSGNPLTLATGQTAAISLQVPSGMAAEAAALGTCPLWYYDTAAGLWIEEGTATYNAASQTFTGTIGRLSGLSVSGTARANAAAPPPSWWNVDRPLSNTLASINGRVIDSAGLPVSSAYVVCQAAGWMQSAYTLSDGTYQIRVESGTAFNCRAQKHGQFSSTASFGPYVSGTDNNVADLTLDSSAVQITLSWGAEPKDLDTHLTVPSPEGSARYDLYYSNRSSTPANTWPSVKLDTDAQLGFGPEIASVNQLFPGTYRYCVHHYPVGGGSATISGSGAKVNLIVSGGGTNAVYEFLPPSGATGQNDVWTVFDLVVDNSGAIAAINEIKTIKPNIMASSHEAFSPNDQTTIGIMPGTTIMTIKQKGGK